MPRKHRGWWKAILRHPSLIEYAKVGVILALLAAVTVNDSSASLLNQRDISAVPAFSGTVMPIRHTLNWTSLSQEENKQFRTGQLTFHTAGNKLVPLMPYEAAKLCSTDPAEARWNDLSKTTRNMFLTYVTAFSGKYSGGSEKACEGVGSHSGVDIRAPKGTPVVAVANGMVTKSGYSSGNGNYVCILHPNVPPTDGGEQRTDYISCSLHMDNVENGIREGVIVLKEDRIGSVGKTGLATTYHLHFQIDKADATFHPYWPYSNKDAQKAGMSYLEAVDRGLNKENLATFAINPLEWIQRFRKMVGQAALESRE